MFKWLKKLFEKEDKEYVKYPTYDRPPKPGSERLIETNPVVYELSNRLEEIKNKTSYTDLEPTNSDIYDDYYIPVNKDGELYKYIIEIETTISTYDDCDYKKEELIFYNSEKIEQNEFKNIVSKYYKNGKFNKNKFLEENKNFIELPEFNEEEIKVTISNVIII